MTQLVIFNVFNGLIIGAFYALMALGLSLILNLSGVINFAHGGFLAIGGYLAYMLIPYVGFWGALLVAPVLTAGIGLVVERLLIRRLYGRDPLYSLLLTFGLAFMLEDGTRYIWGAQSLPYQVPSFLTSPLSSEYFFLTGYRVFMVVLVAFAVGGLFFIINHTRAGMLGLQPTIGSSLIMPSFVAIIVGGLGSLPGTLLGGLLIGVASGMTTVFLPSASEAVIYMMMGLVLLLRPRGLLGEEGRLQ